MAENKQMLLTIGAFILILAVSITLYAVNIINWSQIAPLILALSGIWLLYTAWAQRKTPKKYQRSAFSTMSLGLLLLAVAGAWYLLSFSWLYSLSLLLFTIAALIIVAALKHK
ncbi:MAG: hypothetical protein N3D85_00185 [Candidatus Bathyarchaeota archaeon]|nr:hypothetical protein [Candidatus Bathyarchaeota archaeon]